MNEEQKAEADKLKQELKEMEETNYNFAFTRYELKELVDC